MSVLLDGEEATMHFIDVSDEEVRKLWNPAGDSPCSSRQTICIGIIIDGNPEVHAGWFVHSKPTLWSPCKDAALTCMDPGKFTGTTGVSLRDQTESIGWGTHTPHTTQGNRQSQAAFHSKSETIV